jgi:hypothetical protein
MKLAADAHLEIERFLRRHFLDPELRLPSPHVHTGWFARCLMKAIKMGAVTFGRHIFVAPAFVERDAEGKIVVPAWLIAHESTHILQYQEAGYIKFFYHYLRGYWRALVEGGKWDASGRMAAYKAIAAEREAHAVEDAYRERG